MDEYTISYGKDFMINDSNIIDAIALLSKDVVEAITLLSTTLSLTNVTSDGIIWLQLLSAVFVVVIGAFSAYLFNFFHWRMIERKQKLSKIGNILSLLINELELIAVDYWVKDYNKEDKNNIHASEISIKSKLFIISKYINFISPELNTKKAKFTKQKLKDFNSMIFDLVTGEKFESVTRKSSKSRAMLISKRCSNIKVQLSSLDF